MSSIFYKEYMSMLSTLTITSLLYSFVFSIIIMLFGRGLFFKLEKSPNSSLVPIYNLFVLNEGLDINPIFTILYFVPFINLIYYVYICYKLGKIFSESYDFRLGLVFMPYIYFKFLSNNKKQIAKYEEEQERQRQEILNDALLYTDDKLKELNDAEEDDENKVDSIFKSEFQKRAEEAPKYKAAVKTNNNLDFDAIDDKHKVVFIPAPREHAAKEDIIKSVETKRIDSNEDTNHENEIDVYEIK